MNLKRGTSPKKTPGDQRYHKREREYGEIDSDLLEAGKRIRSERDQQADGGIGDAESGEPAEQSQGDAFSEKLFRHAGSIRSERRSKGELALAALRAHQEEVGHVGAGDEKNQAHGSQQNPERSPDVSDHVLFERPDVGAESRLFQHFRACKPLGNGKRSVASEIIRATSAFASSMVDPFLSRAIPW